VQKFADQFKRTSSNSSTATTATIPATTSTVDTKKDLNSINARQLLTRNEVLEMLLPYVIFESLPTKFLYALENSSLMNDVHFLHQKIHQAYRYKIHPRREEMKVRRRRYGLSLRFDPENIGYNLRLSNGDLTLSHKHIGSTQEMCVTTGLFSDAGIYYCEFKTEQSCNGISIGIVVAESQKLNSVVGSDANSWGISGDGTTLHMNQRSDYSLGPFMAGGSVGVFLDLETHTMSFCVNGKLGAIAFDLPRNKVFQPAVSLLAGQVTIDNDAEMPRHNF